MDEDEKAVLRERLLAWFVTQFDSEEHRDDALRAIYDPYRIDAAKYWAAWMYGSELVRPQWLSFCTISAHGAMNLSASPTVEHGAVDEDGEALEVAEAEDESEPYAPPPSEEDRDEEYLHGYDAKWLKRDLVDNDYPWHVAQVTTMQLFNQEYTLHDSLLVGVWLTRRGELITIFRWDSVWVNDEEKRVDFSFEEDEVDTIAEDRYGGDVAFWPYLIIRFPVFHRMDTNGDPHDRSPYGYGDVNGASSENLSEEQREEFFASYLSAWPKAADCRRESAGGIVRTRIQLQQGYDLEVVHGPWVHVLCMNRAGRPVHISDLGGNPGRGQ